MSRRSESSPASCRRKPSDPWLTEALPVTLQIQGFPVPFQLVGMLPYLLTIVVVAGLVGRATAPAAVGVPYRKGQRAGG